MHQFEWLSERGGNCFNLLQKERLPRNRGGGVVLQKREGSSPGGNYGLLKYKYHPSVLKIKEFEENLRIW